MQEAVEVGENLYVKSQTDGDYEEKEERAYYHEEILQSCALVAELKN